jgi:hypothetical protein
VQAAGKLERAAVAGTRVHGAIQGVRGLGESAYHVATGQATWTDLLGLGLTAAATPGFVSSLRGGGVSGLKTYYSGSAGSGSGVASGPVGSPAPTGTTRPGRITTAPPGAHHIDANTLIAAGKEAHARAVGLKPEMGGGLKYSKRNAGNIVVIEAVEAESLKGAGSADVRQVMVDYNVRIIPNPSPSEVSSLVSRIGQKRSGDIDVMALVAAEKHNGVLVTGDRRLLDDALAAKHYATRFRIFEGTRQSVVDGFERGRNLVVILKTTGPKTSGHPRKGWPKDPGVPNPHNITGSPLNQHK